MTYIVDTILLRDLTRVTIEKDVDINFHPNYLTTIGLKIIIFFESLIFRPFKVTWQTFRLRPVKGTLAEFFALTLSL